MAGLKKKKKEKSGNPNIVLVIFLVLFVISTITLGYLFYLALDEKDNFRTQRTRAEADRKAEKQHAEYFEMLYNDLRLTMGETLDAKTIEEVKIYRDVFIDDNNAKYKGETTREAAKALMMKLHSGDLGGGLGEDYPKKYPELYKEALAKIDELEGKKFKEAQEHAKTKALLNELTGKQDKLYQDVLDRIGKEGAAYLKELAKNTDNFKVLSERVVTLNQEIKDKEQDMEKLKEEQETKLKIKDKLIRVLEAERNETNALKAQGINPAPTLTRGDNFPLLLDISPGKPLWDQPVGKITRVDLDLRQVVINVGLSHGAKPELTFNVFGPNPSGRAEKSMKGSIEVIKVLDTSSSLCRITSLFDSEGYEIPLGAGVRGQILRETDMPVREGDLLFNLFWGTRVAIAGYVSITGTPSDNPSEQNAQMEDFLALCKRNGMQVDAFVDLRDGQIKGNITSKTRYLIRGVDFLPADERKAAAKAPAEEAKEGEEKKEPAAKEPAPPVNAQRNDAVNKSNAQLRNDAKALGLLQISAENFVTVIGYRKARNANSVEVPGFRPMLPYAGSAEAGAMRAQPMAPMPMPEEKKVEEKMQ